MDCWKTFWRGINRVLGKEGATLLEVLVTVVIVGFSVSAVLGLFVMNLRASESNREHAACVLLVADVMERLRAIPFESRLGGKNISGLSNSLSSSDSLSSFYEYLGVDPPPSVLQIIPQVLSWSTLNLVQKSPEEYVVELRVRWKEDMNVLRFVTLVVKGGINDLLQKD